MNRKTTLIGLLLLFCLMGHPLHAAQNSVAQINRFQKHIVDYRSKLNRHFKKILRKKTQYIIIHTSEAGLKSTLRTVSHGKRMKNRHCTRGGHANYVVARNGKTYRILNKRYIADHAGRSMWDGETHLSRISIGIELVGYHYGSITPKQYKSLGLLVRILQHVYGIPDKNILTHSQIAYGRPNPWYDRNHRGRKRCAKNFDRTRIGLRNAWPYDPDVKAGRLMPDRQLAKLFYGPKPDRKQVIGSNVITQDNTAWAIAGEDYDAPETLYQLPNGTLLAGDVLGRKLGWNNIPHKTLVLLNQEVKPLKMQQSAFKTVTDGLTAWTIAGTNYNERTTYYFYPNGKIKNGRQISDWDDLPVNTKVILGYRRPFKINRGKSPIQLVGKDYNHKSTLYYFPNKKLISGDRISDFRSMPVGVYLFLPTKKNV